MTTLIRDTAPGRQISAHVILAARGRPSHPGTNSTWAPETRLCARRQRGSDGAPMMRAARIGAPIPRTARYGQCGSTARVTMA